MTTVYDVLIIDVDQLTTLAAIERAVKIISFHIAKELDLIKDASPETIHRVLSMVHRHKNLVMSGIDNNRPPERIAKHIIQADKLVQDEMQNERLEEIKADPSIN